ncbi:murein hydrolase activator EnvC family protein [Streptomyces rochei]|uniref:murein hydrolase activator EnvC family protein n=1 Tax=Streptomyces rochei TaxID=1928 RepID=UPI0037FAF43C
MTGRWVSAGVWVVVLLTVVSPGPPEAGRAPYTRAAAAATAVAEGVDRLPDPGVPAVARGWPVGDRPTVLRGWEPPATPYGRGHRGVDLAAPAGAPVRAVAAGTVSFAGRVAGRGVVSVELAGTGDPPLRTTYEPLAVSVEKGEEVAAGGVLGTVEPSGSHCTGCLHWGLLRGDVYLDPLSLLPPWLLDAGPAVLLPVLGVPDPADPRAQGRQAYAPRT